MYPIAETILAQLGGNRFISMTGAKNFVGAHNRLSFHLPNRKINRVMVTLDASDTYTVEFGKWNPAKLQTKTLTTVSGLHADQLQSNFTAVTGLDTHL